MRSLYSSTTVSLKLRPLMLSSASPLNRASMASGTMPGAAGVPWRVCVFPEPVAPYARTQAFKPFLAASTRSCACSKSSVCVLSGPCTASKKKRWPWRRRGGVAAPGVPGASCAAVLTVTDSLSQSRQVCSASEGLTRRRTWTRPSTERGRTAVLAGDSAAAVSISRFKSMIAAHGGGREGEGAQRLPVCPPRPSPFAAVPRPPRRPSCRALRYTC